MMKRQKTGNLYSKIIRVLALLCFMACLGTVHAQTADQSQDQNLQHPVTKDQRVAAKKRKEQEKQAAAAQKAALKQHMKDQTPAVRKRMKKDARKANLYNEHKREFFLKRWFTRKKP